MNVLFITSLCDAQSPHKPLQNPDVIQFGISYISSYLKSQGHATKLLVLSRMSGRYNEIFIEQAVKEFSPKVVLFTAVATEYPFVASKASYIKNKYPNIFLVIGGVHASLNPGEVIRDSFDAVCVGEGEIPTGELVTQLEHGLMPSGIKNFWFKPAGAVEQNPSRAFVDNLDILPFPDRDMWREWIDEQPDGKHSILLGRGCPFQCTYCCNHALKKLAPGAYVRFRSPENILAEIKELKLKYPEKRDFFLEVETIGAKMDWALELCRQLANYNATLAEPLTFGVNLRVTPNVDYEILFRAFQKCNLTYLTIGLESGSERIRRDVLKRIYSNEDIIKAVATARKFGLRVGFQNMLGLPEETWDDFQETVKLNRQCQPDYLYLSIFYPYPGTDLFFLCKERGLMKGKVDPRMERNKAVLDLPYFSKPQIQNQHTWFEYNVYKGHRPAWKLYLKVLLSLLKSNYVLYFLYRRIQFFPFFKQLKIRLTQ
ncbi:MAG: B12-binding domain-containing radical SAM protein [Candidatus Omnitrophica bacterium]|nr:B12-binding domain-containing radical SAM protein [Candidatus Omnitrophota bacterium]